MRIHSSRLAAAAVDAHSHHVWHGYMLDHMLREAPSFSYVSSSAAFGSSTGASSACGRTVRAITITQRTERATRRNVTTGARWRSSTTLDAPPLLHRSPLPSAAATLPHPFVCQVLLSGRRQRQPDPLYTTTGKPWDHAPLSDDVLVGHLLVIELGVRLQPHGAAWKRLGRLGVGGTDG